MKPMIIWWSMGFISSCGVNNMRYFDTWNPKLKDLTQRVAELKSERKFISQHDEEGIIQAIFEVCEPQNKWCVEVGAQDGKADSNTWTLIQKGWQGVLIEGNNRFFQQLKENYNEHDRVCIVNRIIDTSWINSENNLKAILERCGVPKDFDFFSLDIDSYEYEVWRNLVEFEPNLICIECNSVEEDFDVIDYDSSYSVKSHIHPSYGGATVGLLNRLAKEKGYDFVCVERCNAFYIKKEFGKDLLK